MSFPPTTLYNVLHGPDVVGKPDIDYRNFEWRIRVKFGTADDEEVVDVTGATLLEAAERLRGRQRAFWQRLVPEPA